MFHTEYSVFHTAVTVLPILEYCVTRYSILCYPLWHTMFHTIEHCVPQYSTQTQANIHAHTHTYELQYQTHAAL